MLISDELLTVAEVAGLLKLNQQTVRNYIDRGELERLYQRSAFQADQDLVFANAHTGRPLNGNALGKTFDRALRRAAVHRITFHELRHTFGTRLAAAGVPMRTLQELMGHADIATTMIYAHYAPSEHEVDLVNAAFAGTDPGTNLSATETNSNHRNPADTGLTA